MSHSRIHSLLAFPAAVVAACTIATPRAASQPSAPEVTDSCLVVGFGQWLPRDPDWLPQPWRSILPALRLGASPSPITGKYFRDARIIGPAPEASADSVGLITTRGRRAHYFLYGWRTPSADTLVLFDPIVIDNGVELRGVWREGILRGRAHSFSDIVAPEIDPRANAYAARYACGDRAAWQQAREAIAELVARDIPDPDAAAREIAEEREVVNRSRRP
jgi:hypothetical protein